MLRSTAELVKAQTQAAYNAEPHPITKQIDPVDPLQKPIRPVSPPTTPPAPFSISSWSISGSTMTVVGLGINLTTAVRFFNESTEDVTDRPISIVNSTNGTCSVPQLPTGEYKIQLRNAPQNQTSADAPQTYTASAA